jgi:flagellar secretion chaperone FliS
MTFRSNPWKAYQQAATQTAGPGQLVLMLYDGAIRFLCQAEHGFTLEDPLEYNLTIHNNITRAQAIINELNYSLNMPQGGEFAQKMRSLYDYFDRRLMESNLHKESKGVHEVMQRLTVLRDAWSEMLQRRSTEHATPEIAESVSAVA